MLHLCGTSRVQVVCPVVPIVLLSLQLPPSFQAGTSVAASLPPSSTTMDCHCCLSSFTVMGNINDLLKAWSLLLTPRLTHLLAMFRSIRRYYRDGSSVGTVGLTPCTNLWPPTSHVLTLGLLLTSSKFTDLRPTLHMESTTTGLPHRLLRASALALISVGPPSCKA